MNQAVRETRLRRYLADPPAVAATPLDALALARKRFLANEPLDMSSMAAELGVSRATLHRWVGTRLELLAEVAVELCERSLRTAVEESRPAQGTALLVAAFTQFAGYPATRRLMTEHFERESGRSVRALVDPEGLVRPRLLAVFQDLIVAQTNWPVDDGLATVSDAALRLVESHLWLGCLVGRRLDVPLLRAQLELVFKREEIPTG
jgi:AcrR family transcriptional regulator